MALKNNKINGNDLKQEALKLCQDFLGSPWNNIDISDFRITTVSGGLSNKLYCCSITSNVFFTNPKIPRQVLLRIYGPIQDEEHRKVVEAATFVLLAEKKLGPKLYGVFPTGRLEEYIPSRSLKQNDLKQFSTSIAKMLAKIHTLNVPVTKKPDLWQNQMKRWLRDAERDTLLKYKESYSLAEFYKEEINWLSLEMKNAKSPIVYCHNDLLGGNILLREDNVIPAGENIIFIDFEYGGYNYRGFDLANHFSEWIYEYGTPEPPHFKVDTSKYPTKEERLKFIKAYLGQLVEEGALSIDEVDAETSRLMTEIQPFGMASHLCWSMWCEKMKFESDLGEFYEEYGKTRRTIYQKLKDTYPKKS